jgi:polyhydroxyalkanoate synthesis repressor PhaR
MNDKSSQKDKNRGKDDRIVIKKYANRRLYNTKTSAYIVLSDVIDLINEGTEFVIEDAKTGEDITRGILNQIIFEQETQPNTFLFPLEFQKQLIRLYNDTYGHMVPNYLTQSIKFFTAERGAWQNDLKDMVAQNTENMMRQSEALARQNMEMFRKSWDIFGVMEAAEKKSREKPEETPQEERAVSDSNPEEEGKRSDELQEIQHQIDLLQSRLKSLK